MPDIIHPIIEYALTFPGVYLDYPFHNDIATLRHRQNQKIFLFIIPRSGEVWLNLKCEPMKADFWRGIYPCITRGYHMNDKASWNTIHMDGSVPLEVVREMIGDSYDLLKAKVKKRSVKVE